MIFIPQRIILKNLTPEFFFAECERQYVFEQAIEKKMAAKEYLENKLNNSSKRKRASLAKEIMNIKDNFNWVTTCSEYRCWKIQHKYALAGDLNDIVKNIEFVFGEFKNN